MPIGYLFSTGLMATFVLFAVRPPRPSRSSPFRVSFWLAFLVNELPFLALYVLVASTALAVVQNGTASPVFWAGLSFAVAASFGLVVVVRRALRTAPAIDRALRDGLGSDWRAPTTSRRRVPYGRVLFAPFLYRRRDVERVNNIRYGEAGRANLLDVYRPRSHPSGGPTLVHLHGGAFVMGRKSREARALLYRLASEGWVCISANYRLGSAGRFPAALIDVKKVLAWVRLHGEDFGAHPDEVFLSGSSAGAYLATQAALTANESRFQPGFELVDTSVAAVIGLYGYYGNLDPDARSGAEPPPFFVAHPELDTLVVVDDARRFVARLRVSSRRPVVYAELPGGQHSFDLFHSIRFEAVIDGVEAFARAIAAPARAGRSHAV
jgi:acetyl esterase/lipase